MIFGMKNLFFKNFYEFSDLKYKQFIEKLIPNIDKEKILGIKAEYIDNFAKSLILNDEQQMLLFLNSLPHYYLEENLLHIKLLSLFDDYQILIKYIDNFLPYIDNWMVCDSLIPKIFNKNKNKLFFEIDKWIKLNRTYSIRYALIVALKFLLNNNIFDEKIISLFLTIKNNDYYVKMAIAWFFSEAIIKQYSVSIKYLENKIFDKWIQNKIISKCCDSKRLTDDTKKYLKSLRINNEN